MSMTNCVNCGSAKEISETVCPFCGTSYFDLTDIDLSDNRKPSIVRFKYGGAIFQMKAFVNMASFEIVPDVYGIADGCGGWHSLISNNNVTAHIEFISCE